VVTSSWGGNIALRLATRRPDVFRSVTCHEPPLWDLVWYDPESQAMLQQGAGSDESVGRKIADGDHEGAARQFVEEVTFGLGAWENELPPEARETFMRNAPTYFDELQDSNAASLDADALTRLDMPGTPHGRLRVPTGFPSRHRSAREVAARSTLTGKHLTAYVGT
jgi:pimeloyl-ACP methyl ester carboxylesterase